MRSTSSRRTTSRTLLASFACVLAVLLLASRGLAEVSSDPRDDVRNLDVPTSPVTEAIPAADPEPPRVSIGPDRFTEQRVARGETLRFPVVVRNTTGRAIVLRTAVLPLTGSRNPASLVTVGAASSPRARAREWTHLPGPDGTDWTPTLAAHSQLTFPVEVRVPRDAVPGAYAVAVTVGSRVVASSADAPQVRLDATAGSQILLDVDGAARSAAKVLATTAPRVLWRHGSDAAFTVRVRNTGDTILDLQATADVAPFLGRGGRTLRSTEQQVLPDGVRELRVRWTDPPLLGRYHPTLRIADRPNEHVLATRSIPTVWVLPPWWLLLALAAAIALPVGLSVLRRRARTDADDEY